MYTILLNVVIASMVAATASAQGIITTVAGGDPTDGTLALAAGIPRPTGVARDHLGNLYFSSYDAGRVYKVDNSGRVYLVAGSGISPFIDGVPAVNASLVQPLGLAVDAAGNLFIAESGTYRIRRIDAITGIIATVAGNANYGVPFSGDDGPATSAGLNFPEGIAVDASGNLFIADTSNQRIRRVDASTGIITTVAGNGTAGFNGDGILASTAQLNYPSGVAVDSAGNLFIADSFNSRVRRVDSSTGIITTIATERAVGVAVDSPGNVYYTTTLGSLVRRVDASTHVVTTVAGNGASGFSGDGGPAVTAALSVWFLVSGLTLDTSNNIWVADTDNFRIREILAATGIISTVAGTGSPGDGGPAAAASLAIPEDVAVDGSGNIFIADQQNRRVRRVDAITGVITTVAGGAPGFVGGDGGLATSAVLCCPSGVALDSSGNLFIGDGSRVRRVDATTGIISTVAGNFAAGFSGDGGAATSATLSCCFLPVTLDTDGNLFIVDTNNNRVRRVDRVNGTINTVAGNGTAGFNGDGLLAADARLNVPSAAVVDAGGSLFIADTGNQRVRRVDAVSGFISTVAGTGTVGFIGSNGDGGLASSARLNGPAGVAFDSLRNLFVSELGGAVRRIDVATGVITTVAGRGCCFGGDGGPATNAWLNGPRGLAVDGSNLFIADVLNNRIRGVTLGPFASLTGASLSFGTQEVGTTSPPQAVVFRNTGTAPLTINSVEVSGDFVQTNTCGAFVPSGASCAFSVSFVPSAAGSRTGSITVTDDAFGGPQVINLTGGGAFLPTLAVAGGAFTYDGSPHAATATATGPGGVTVPGSFTFEYSPGGTAAPVNAGTYLVTARFTSSDSDYLNASATGLITISQAAPTVTLTGGTFVYNGGPRVLAATATGVGGAPVSGSFAFAYTPGGPTPPVNIGTYSVTAAFTSGDPNYTNAVSAPASIVITPATPTLGISGSFTYDGTPHPAIVTATGAGGAPVAGSFTVTYSPGGSTPPINAGTHGVTVAFVSADPNYTDASATGSITVNPATPTVMVSGGTFTYDAAPHPATATATGIGGVIVPGTFTFGYLPGGSSAPVNAGTYSVTATFTSSDQNYADVNDVSGSNIPTVGLWVTAAPMATARYCAASAWIDGKLYLVGGEDASGRALNVLEVYDPARNAWTAKAPMPTARACSAAGAIGGKLYVAGGVSNRTLTVFRTLEVYDPASNTWTSAASMPMANGEGASAVIDGKLYAVGGIAALIFNNPRNGVLQVYDPATNTWATKSPMPTARSSAGAAVFNGQLFVVGGFPNLTTTAVNEVYDPATDTWTTKAPMPTVRGGLIADVVNGRIYAIGGYKNGAYYSINEVYDPIANTWATAAPMPTARLLMAAAVTESGSIYVVGGQTSATVALTLVEVFDPPGGLTTITISPATPSVTVAGGTFTYNGSPHACTAGATGIGGAPVAGTFALSYTPGGLSAPVNAGIYTVAAAFTSADPNYTDAVSTSTALITINPAVPTVGISGTFVYDGNPHAAAVLVSGAGGANVPGLLTVTYSPGGSTPPVNAGTYLASAAFASADPNYTDATGIGSMAIGRATPTVVVSGGSFPYDESPHPATAAATGVGGAAVPGSFAFSYSPGGSSPPVDAGTYSVTAVFTSGDPNYADVTVAGSNCVVVPPGLVSWWPADGHAEDINGGNAGALRNGATFAPGKVGQAFSLAGMAFVEIPDSPTLTPPSSSLTVNAWVKPSGFGGTIISKYGRADASWALLSLGSGQLRFDVRQDGAGSISRGIDTNSSALALGVWQHVAATFDVATQSMKIYVNGVEAPSSLVEFGTPSFLFDSTSPVRIGTYQDGNGFLTGFWNGLIDEVELYNRALSPGEVQGIYNAGSQGDCTGSITINSATPAATASGGTFAYTGGPHAATAVATGVGGAPVSGSFTFTYTPGGTAAPVNVGTYSVVAAFTSGDPNYTNATSNTASIAITPSTPTVTVTGTFTYDGSPHPATATATGVGGVVVPGSFDLTYTPGGPSAPVNAGTSSVDAHFTSGDPNYINASHTGSVTINPVTPTVTVTGGTFTYDGTAHPAIATATGLGGASVPGTFSFTYAPGGASAPVSPGTYSVTASFTSTDPNYANASATGNGPSSPRLAYIANSSSNTVSAFVINPANGALTPTGTLPTGGASRSVAVDPTGRFVYVANSGGAGGTGSISGYRIETGLTPIPGSTFTTGEISEVVAIDPKGRFVYVTNAFSNNVSGFSINSLNGALTPIAGSPFPAGTNPESIVADPSGRFAYVANCGSRSCAGGSFGNISAYTIDAETGALAPVSGSPFAAGRSPIGATVDPAGHLVYVANEASNSVSAFAIDPTSGALAEIVGSPFGGLSGPVSVAVDPADRILYVANAGSNTVAALAINAATGALAPVTGSPFPAGSYPFKIIVDPTGRWAFVTNQKSNNVSAYAIDAVTGTLTPIVGSPFAVGSDPLSIALASYPGLITIRGTPTVAVNSGPFTYDGLAHSATASATGTGGAPVAGSFTFTYTPGGSAPPVTAGTYAVTAAFTSADPAYIDVPGASGSLTIDPAIPTIDISGGPFMYDGLAHPVSASVTGVGGGGVAGSLDLTYAPGGTSAPVNAGMYSVTVAFTSGDPNYASTARTASLTINPATPTVTVTGGVFGYNGLAHPATAAATGVAGALVSGSFGFSYTPGGTVAPITIGDYTVAAAFTSADPNYANASGSGSISVIPLSPLASVTLATDRPVYPRAQPVQISGRVTSVDGSGIPNIPVAVQLSVNGSIRTFSPYTDAQGGYHVLFQPTATDNGTFSLTAATTAGGVTQTAHASFRIFGLLVSPGVVSQDLVMGTEATVPLTLQNIGDAALQNLAYSVMVVPDGVVTASISSSTTTLAPGGSTTVPVILTASAGDPPAGPISVHVQITGTDATSGAVDQESSTLVMTLRPGISTPVLTPASLSVGVNPGQGLTRRFRVTNTGFLPMAQAMVALQDPAMFSWVSLGNASLGDVLPGEAREFQVLINPPADLALGDYAVLFNVTGGTSSLQSVVNISVTQSTLGAATFIVSDDTGAKVSGASVSVYNSSAGTLFQAVTGEDGQAALTGVPAGDYAFVVTAESHDPVSGTVGVTANATATVAVLLSYDVVSLSFTVTPTTIVDQYNVTLNVTYATKLPKPALQVVPYSLDFAFFPEDVPDGKFACSLEITNTHPTASVRNVIVDASQLDLDQPDGQRLHVFFPDGASVYQVGVLPGKGSTTVGCYATLDSGSLLTHRVGNILVQANYDFSLDGQVLEGTTTTKVPVGYVRPDELSFQPIEFIYDMRTDPDHPVLKYNAGSFLYSIKSHRNLNLDLLKPSEAPFIGRNLVAFTAALGGTSPLEVIAANQSNVFWRTDFNPDKQSLAGAGEVTTFDISALDPPGGSGSTLEQALNAQIAANADQILNLPTYLGFEGQWADSATAKGFLIPVHIWTLTEEHLKGPARGDGGELCEDPNSPLCQGFPDLPRFARDGTILLAIDQKVRLERQAFNATLGIDARATLASTVATVQIRDLAGNDAADRFFVLVTADSAGATRGASISGQASVSWQLIPSADAGGTSAQGTQYTVQATLNYVASGAAKSVTIPAVTITVLPSPKLTVAYTVPFVVVAGKDAKIRVTVQNVGAGVAHNLSLQSAQPRIIASIPDDPGDDPFNPILGPIVDFTLTGASNTADGTGFQSGNLAINFGDVAPGATVSGYWTLQVSRRGFFIDVSTTFSHQDYRGIPLDPLVLPPTIALVPAIGGLVRVVSGPGIPGLTVTLSQGGALLASDTTDSSGVYYIPDLAPGAYLQEVKDLSGTVLASKDITVLADQGTNFIDFVLESYNPTEAIVVVDSDQPGFAFTADGNVFTTPHSFQWAVDSTHAIELSSATTDGQSVAAGWGDGETSRARTVTVGPFGAELRAVIVPADVYYRYTRTQLTSDPIDHKWPSTNTLGDIVWSEQIDGYWQVLLRPAPGGPPPPATCQLDARGVCQITTDAHNHQRPTISDDETMAWFQDGTGGGLGYAVMRLDPGSTTPSVVEYSSRNVNTKLNCRYERYYFTIIETGCSTNFQEHAAGKTFGMASNGRTISYYTFYDHGYATNRPFNVSGIGKLPEGSTPPANFVGYGSPDVNSTGDLVYANDFVAGVTSTTRYVRLATTVQPFASMVIDEGQYPRISEGPNPEVVYIKKDVGVTHWRGADSPNWVAVGSWADITGTGARVEVVYECMVNGYNQICKAIPAARIRVMTNLGVASFRIDNIDGSVSVTGSGKSFTLPNVSSGTYKIIYNPVAGFRTPDAETKTVGPGETIVFAAEYQSEVGLSLVADHDHIAVGRALRYTAAVWTAVLVGGLTLTIDLPPAVEIQSVTDGRCSIGGGSIQCNIGTLQQGSSFSVDAVVEPVLHGDLDAGVSVIALGGAPLDQRLTVSALCSDESGKPYDDDGDGLPNCWEVEGVDVTPGPTPGSARSSLGGPPDLDLRGMGARPDHKDVFVEIDAMPSAAIGKNAFDDVVRAFAEAPVRNLDGTEGIALHVDNGPDSQMSSGRMWGSMSRSEKNLPEQEFLGDASFGEYDWKPFDKLKCGPLGGCAQSILQGNHFDQVRLRAFHYAVAARSIDTRSIAEKEFAIGIARKTLTPDGYHVMEGSDFVLGLEPYCSDEVNCDRPIATTFMHELGHNLGLHHGGNEDIPQMKPNYLSVMNYAFSLTGLIGSERESVREPVFMRLS